MGLTPLTMLLFASGALGAAATGMLVRDVASARRPAPRRRWLKQLAVAERHPVRLSLIGRIDRWFRNLILETGWELSPTAAALLMATSGLAIGGAAFLWSDDLLATAAAAAVGAALPLPWFMHARRQRVQQFHTQLPDALELLSRAVRAGESIDQAMGLAGRKTSQPLAREFRRAADQLDMGLALPAAMRALAVRVPTADMRIFTAAVSVHRQAGGNLATTLERMSMVVRERLAYRRQLRATTAAGRFSARLISLAGPLLFAYLFIFQHDYVGKLLHEPLGQSLLGIAVALEFIGLAWIGRMLKEPLS